jgi:hypothetical protein
MKYPTIFEPSLLSVLVPKLPVQIRTPTGLEVISGPTMVMEYRSNYGNLEPLYANGNIPQDQIHQEQIERRFIMAMIFGFVDQNMGNELIVDKQMIETENGPKEMLRLASIDMGQCNPSKRFEDVNPPFYKSFKCMKDPKFYENVAVRIKNVDFERLINDLAILYAGNGAPLTKDQIKLMIFRCEMLKVLTAQGIGTKKISKAKAKLLSRYGELVTALKGPNEEEFQKMFAPAQKILGIKFLSDGIRYEVQGKVYKFTPQNTTVFVPGKS